MARRKTFNWTARVRGRTPAKKRPGSFCLICSTSIRALSEPLTIARVVEGMSSFFYERPSHGVTCIRVGRTTVHLNGSDAVRLPPYRCVKFTRTEPRTKFQRFLIIGIHTFTGHLSPSVSSHLQAQLHRDYSTPKTTAPSRRLLYCKGFLL